MSGSGIATIKYRNCWTDASSYAIVYLAGTEISRSSSNGDKAYTVKSFAYTTGQLVEIKDAGSNAVVEVYSF